jgi:hypothetical protein
MKRIILVIFLSFSSLMAMADEHKCRKLRAEMNQLDKDRQSAYWDGTLSEASSETITLALAGLYPLTRIKVEDGSQECASRSFWYFNSLKKTFNRLIEN